MEVFAKFLYKIQNFVNAKRVGEDLIAVQLNVQKINAAGKVFAQQEKMDFKIIASAINFLLVLIVPCLFLI